MADLLSATLPASTIVAAHSLDRLAYHLNFSCSQIVIFTHPSLWSIYGERLESQLSAIAPFTVLHIPEGEGSKSLVQAKRCWQHLARKRVDRNSLILALGGGVICDLAGFVASVYMRGIDAVYLPTSLLAMVDAAIGGKTGINLGKNKNVIGSFHLPKRVLIDPLFLRTLPRREYTAGFAEVIKYGMIAHPPLLDLLEQHWHRFEQKDEALLEEVIKQSCTIKQWFVDADFKDRGIRAQLNYGHTFGHAIESLTHYQYLHGEAVAIGMSYAAHLSLRMNLTDRATVQRQDEICKQIGLPLAAPPYPITRFIALMKSDKKASDGKINLILLEKIGKVIQVFQVNPSLIKQILLEHQIKISISK